MSKATKQQQSHIAVTKAQDQTTGQTVSPSETTTASTEEAKAAVRPAYLTYLKARKGLAEAFRGRERRDQEAYRDAERQYQIYEEAIEKAMRVREKAERDALDEYRDTVDKAVENASLAYKARMKQARMNCKQGVVDAWRNSMETSTQIAEVFEQNGNQYHEDNPPQGGLRFRDTILHWKNSSLSVIRRAITAFRG